LHKLGQKQALDPENGISFPLFSVSLQKLDQDAAIEIVLRDDEEALDLIRHDTAHIMAEAVQELWPGTQVTIGPSIEYGFYYD